MRRVLPLFFLLLVACSPAGGVKEGLVTTLEGEPAVLENFTEGKPALVNFWAGWCTFCKEEMPLLQQVDDEHPGIAVVGVNLQENQSVARAYAEAGGYSYVNLLDPGSELRERFGVFTQPTTFVLDPEGNELHRKDGPFTEQELQGWVEELLLLAPQPEEPEQQPQEQPPEVQTSQPTQLLSLWYQEEVKHTIPLEQVLSGGQAKDGIPSIDSPQFMEAAQATPEFDELQGIFVSVEDDARFYPLAILNWHEIVNDTVGGKPVAVTYCPLCASAVVYDRGGAQFGVSGLLYQSNLLLFDRSTNSLWNQITGEAVVGPLVGSRLPRIKSDITTLGAVKQAWPQAKVLTTITGFVRDYSADPYEGYDQVESVFFPVSTVDDRLVSKKIVYGVVVDGFPKAYTFSAIRDEKRIQDVVGSVRILIQYDEATQRVRFTRMLEGGESEEVVPVRSFWFAWVAQYPETGLYE